MIKRTITYKDYNDLERTEDFYFNLSKAELVELEISEEGSFEEMLDKIIKGGDHIKIIPVFKRILLLSYGVKSDDGRRFMKTQEIRDSFEQTEAFSQMYVEMFTHVEEAVDFVKGILPRDLAEQVEQTPTHVEIKGEPVIPELEKAKDPRDMSKEELLEAYRQRVMLGENA